jgi:hypothetical protein
MLRHPKKDADLALSISVFLPSSLPPSPLSCTHCCPFPFAGDAARSDAEIGLAIPLIEAKVHTKDVLKNENYGEDLTGDVSQSTKSRFTVARTAVYIVEPHQLSMIGQSYI